MIIIRFTEVITLTISCQNVYLLGHDTRAIMPTKITVFIVHNVKKNLENMAIL